MGHRWRDLWLEIEVRHVASFPFFRLSLRSDWGTPRQAEQNRHPRIAANGREAAGSRRRAA
jgi:hypothetical protein